MCGICGIFEADLNRPVPPEVVEHMATSIRHRGPDEGGFHFEPGVGLGHRRLSIIDLSSGQQPMTNEDGTIWVVFNGEIYNFPELRAMLEAKGHSFRTRSDTEAIIHLYEECGEDCFRRLRGMFAIALWDRQRRRLVLARDRVGKKPLFYAWDGRRLVFGSELKAILAAGGINRRLDPTALCDYFTFLYVPAPKTIYAAVRKVRPAHYLVVRREGIREQAYWDLNFGEVEEKSEKQWQEELREALFDAVQVRLMSEVPLGSFLSGGIDSSAVAAAMSRLMDRPVTTCTVGFDEQAYSEVEYAREVARHIRAEYRETTVRPKAAEAVERLAWHYDEPFADSSAVPTYYVSKAARESVTVALSGDGGDENFAGYRRYLYERQANRLRGLCPAWLRRRVLGPLGRWYPQLDRAPHIFRAKSVLESLARDPLEGYLAKMGSPSAVRAALLSGDIQRELGGYDPFEQFREHYRRAGTPDLLSRIQYLDIKTYLTDDICVKVDRASMAVSLEVRAPLLDHNLMEFAARIPSRLKLREGTGKHIFKQAIRDLLPPKILGRGKQGFSMPVAEWFRGELREVAVAALFDGQDGILNRDYLERLWHQHQAGIRDHSALLWTVFMFRQWQRLFRGDAAVAGSEPASPLLVAR